MLLNDRVAIITGASRGIGRAIALTLAEQGANVVINGNNEAMISTLKSEIEQMGRKCHSIIGDVSQPETSSRLAECAITNFGRIDILVNNAGINSRVPTLEMDIADWQRVMDVNLNGTLFSCREVLPQMITQKYGKIINISSTTSKTPHKNASPSYGASKAGVNYLTQHLALEMAPYNIYVNAVCPGPVETDMTEQWSEDYRKKVLSNIPLGKLGQPQHVADTVLFLASRMSDFITGETINVNGGTFMN